MRRKPSEISGQKHQAGRCQDELLVQPLEQTHAQALLKRFHLLANGGWRDMQFMRGQFETEMPRRGFERAERVKGWEDVGHRRPVCH
jgi:hypothetical protein